ncbi:MAG: TIGR00730 family Rossman fold protein [Planctomycetes bacterium]|nr:TIGR00730 family Rossman fold protein [Planctomycetota bacterium]
MKNKPEQFYQIHDHTPQQPEDEGKSYGIEHYVQQLHETANKLLADHANRGDIKMLSVALRELRYCFKVFANYRERPQVTVFGSARLPQDDPSCQQAVEFSRRIAEAGFMVITGGGNGIMEAGHHGAGRENSIGLNILLPFEQHANAVIRDDPKLMHLRYFFTRKLLFVKECDAVALFPGGFGTLDEAFEVLTLVQTGKSHLFPIVMIDAPGSDYWRHFLRFTKDVLLTRKLISEEDLHMFKVTDSVEDAVAEIVNFYRVYHSMRYVKGDLVVRLRRVISDATLTTIRTEFKNIIKSGTFEVTNALPEEHEETQLAQLPRLKFRFDRHSLGRLRQLIDVVNKD